MTDLKEEIDPHLTHLSLVASSSPITHKDTTVGVMTSLASALPLAPCRGLEIGETFSSGTNFVEDDSLVCRKILPQLSHLLRRLLFRSYVVIE